jgi:hypothetical protein
VNLLRTNLPRARFFLLLTLGIICIPAAIGGTALIDDSGSQAVEPAVSVRWKNAVPLRNGDNSRMTGSTLVRVRLNVMPWLQHAGRVYLVLPTQPPGPLMLAWTSQGALQSGQIHSGDRMLVYAGLITTPYLEDVVNFQFTMDGAVMRQSYPVTFHFEMEEN